MRSFIAVEISEPARLELRRVADEMSRAFPEARIAWEPPERLHVTLCFLGEITLATAEDIGEQLDRQLGAAHAFDLALAGPGNFESVLWVGLGGDVEVLEAIQSTAAGVAGVSGVTLEDREFRPHVTVARAKKGSRTLDKELLEQWGKAAPQPISWKVTGVDVMKSEPTAEGSRYTPLSRVLLKTS